MAGGWKNPLMRDEVGFMILDGAYVQWFPSSSNALFYLTIFDRMIAIASILMTVAFPGAYFPAIKGNSKKGDVDAKNECETRSEELSVLKPARFSQV